MTSGYTIRLSPVSAFPTPPRTTSQACERAARWQEALALLRDMQEAQLDVTSGTFAHVVKACINAGEIGQARALLGEMDASGLRVKKGTIALVEKAAERLRADGGGGGGGQLRSWNELSPKHRTAAGSGAAQAARPDGRAAAPRSSPGDQDGVFNPTGPPQSAAAAAASWRDVLPTATTAAVPPSITPAATSEHQPFRPAVDDPATSADRPNSSATEPVADRDGVAFAAGVDADAGAGVSLSVTAAGPPLPSADSTAAGAVRAPRLLLHRTRAVKDFIRFIGSHSRNGRWSEILSDLDRAVADPNIKVP